MTSLHSSVSVFLSIVKVEFVKMSVFDLYLISGALWRVSLWVVKEYENGSVEILHRDWLHSVLIVLFSTGEVKFTDMSLLNLQTIH